VLKQMLPGLIPERVCHQPAANGGLADDLGDLRPRSCLRRAVDPPRPGIVAPAALGDARARLIAPAGQRRTEKPFSRSHCTTGLTLEGDRRGDLSHDGVYGGLPGRPVSARKVAREVLRRS